MRDRADEVLEILRMTHVRNGLAGLEEQHHRS